MIGAAPAAGTSTPAAITPPTTRRSASDGRDAPPAWRRSSSRLRWLAVRKTSPRSPATGTSPSSASAASWIPIRAITTRWTRRRAAATTITSPNTAATTSPAPGTSPSSGSRPTRKRVNGIGTASSSSQATRSIQRGIRVVPGSVAGAGTGILPPQLLQAAVAAAAGAVGLVVVRLLVVEVLVVLLGAVEGGEGHDLGDERPGEVARPALECRPGLLGEAALRRIVIEDGGAILAAAVAELAVGRDGIDVVPEHLEQLLITDPGRVIGDLDRLGVAGAPGGDLLVARVLRGAAAVAHDHRRDAVQGLERRLHAPE